MPGRQAVRTYDMRKRDASAQANRLAVVEAARRLFAVRWFDEVSLAEVAAEAGVSLATVTRHFASKVDLLLATFEHGEAPVEDPACSPWRPGDVAHSVDQLVDRYEVNGRWMLRVDALRERAPELERVSRRARELFRQWLEVVFGPALPSDADVRGRAMDAIDVALDVHVWARWRGDLGRSVDQTKEELRRSVQRIVDDVSRHG